MHSFAAEGKCKPGVVRLTALRPPEQGQVDKIAANELFGLVMATPAAQTTCSRCGVGILLTTAECTGGLCQLCWQGCPLDVVARTRAPSWHEKVTSYTRKDVEEAVRRAFPETEQADAFGYLDMLGDLRVCGQPTDEQYHARVQMAVLDLSNGDMSRLVRFVDAARRDSRDVTLWSECPTFRSHAG